MKILITVLTQIIFTNFALISCNQKSTELNNNAKTNKVNKKFNPVVYFEIPVKDLKRASKFYTAVFNFKFEETKIDNNEMALFPFNEEESGISGSLAKGEIYKPTKNGVLIYFKTRNIENTFKLVIENKGKILFPKTSNGDLGFVAEFEDSEGNRIALHQTIESTK